MHRFVKFLLSSVVLLLGWIVFTQFVQSPAAAQPRCEKFALGIDRLFHGPYSIEEGKTLPALPDSLKDVDTLLIVYKSKYRMQLYYSGELIKTYIIGLGQEPIGHKQEQGDNRTPEGNYMIIEKAVGPFTGSNPYLGSRWMRINYPNNADAKAGLEKQFITEGEYNKIIASNKAGTEPLKTTRLGGGIGIHGWYGEWPGDDEQDLTWGCITLENEDVEDLYGRVGIMTRVVILP